MDLPGALLILAAVVCYLLALQWGGTTKSWNSPDVYGKKIGRLKCMFYLQVHKVPSLQFFLAFFFLQLGFSLCLFRYVKGLH
jgi:hypothetical protein